LGNAARLDRVPEGADAVNITSLQSALHTRNMRAFLRVIREGESSQGDDAYRTLFGGGLFGDLSKHPNRTITANGYTSTAAGAYQFLSKTWNECRDVLNLRGFTPAEQDLAAVFLIQRRGALDDVLDGRIEDAIGKCNKEWASLPGSPYGQPVMTLEKALRTYRAWRENDAEVPAATPVPSIPEKRQAAPMPAPPRPDAEPYAAPAPQPEKPKMAIPAIVAALLPTLIESIPKLGKLFGSGSAVAERGKWIALNDNPNAKFIGYHINQLYNPEFTREKVIGEKPENHPTNTTRAWKNEVLGEFYSDSSSQITIEEIYEMCGDPQRKFIQRITPENNVKAYAGYDWGHREQSENEEADAQNKSRSFNCGVILIPDGSRLSIVYAEYLHKSNLDSKKQFVERLFNKYSVSRAVGDIGDAGDLSKDLQQQYGQKFLVSQSCPKVNGYTTFKEDFFPNRIMFEKDYYIEEVLTMMKKGLIRFPYGNLDQIFWLAKHCSSMETKYSKDRSGEMKKHYVKGSEPNDGFMALINAYLAYKFDITEGFKITNPNLMREGNTLKKQQPNIILANIKNNVVRNYIKPNSNNKFSRN
jgi:muramidase (phage lysozyme)